MDLKNKNDIIMHEMYKLAFRASTPSVDFDELLENATINDQGQKVIPFMDYECYDDVLDKIFNDTMDKYGIDGYMRRGFNISFYLGCSPKGKRRGDISPKKNVKKLKF